MQYYDLWLPKKDGDNGKEEDRDIICPEKTEPSQLK